MKHRSRLFAGALCALLAAALIVPAAAHGCHGAGRGHHAGRGRSVQTTVTVCPYENCSSAGRHVHNGVIYCGYPHGDGVCDNNCRALCPYEDCTLAGPHTHSGVPYCGYAHTEGFCGGTCRALCPYEDCALAGPHTHDGVPCCGYAHTEGFCGGVCHGTAAHGC